MRARGGGAGRRLGRGTRVAEGRAGAGTWRRIARQGAAQVLRVLQQGLADLARPLQFRRGGRRRPGLAKRHRRVADPAAARASARCGAVPARCRAAEGATCWVCVLCPAPCHAALRCAFFFWRELFRTRIIALRGSFLTNLFICVVILNMCGNNKWKGSSSWVSLQQRVERVFFWEK